MIKNIFKPLYNNLNSLLPIRFHNVSLKLDNNFFLINYHLKLIQMVFQYL